MCPRLPALDYTDMGLRNSVVGGDDATTARVHPNRQYIGFCELGASVGDPFRPALRPSIGAVGVRSAVGGQILIALRYFTTENWSPT